MKSTLVCYCCGVKLGAQFALVSHATGSSIDRLFSMRPECYRRADISGGTLVKVQRIPVFTVVPTQPLKRKTAP